MSKLQTWWNYSLHYSKLIRKYVFHRPCALITPHEIFEIRHLAKILELHIWEDYLLRDSELIHIKTFHKPCPLVLYPVLRKGRVTHCMAQKILFIVQYIDLANFEDNTLKNIFYVLQSLVYTGSNLFSDQMIL